MKQSWAIYHQLNYNCSLFINTRNMSHPITHPISWIALSHGTSCIEYVTKRNGAPYDAVQEYQHVILSAMVYAWWYRQCDYIVSMCIDVYSLICVLVDGNGDRGQSWTIMDRRGWIDIVSEVSQLVVVNSMVDTDTWWNTCANYEDRVRMMKHVCGWVYTPDMVVLHWMFHHFYPLK